MELELTQTEEGACGGPRDGDRAPAFVRRCRLLHMGKRQSAQRREVCRCAMASLMHGHWVGWRIGSPEKQTFLKHRVVGVNRVDNRAY